MLSLAVQNKEISFKLIEDTLELTEDDIEEFIIECKLQEYVVRIRGKNIFQAALGINLKIFDIPNMKLKKKSGLLQRMLF